MAVYLDKYALNAKIHKQSRRTDPTEDEGERSGVPLKDSERITDESGRIE